MGTSCSARMTVSCTALAPRIERIEIKTRSLAKRVHDSRSDAIFAVIEVFSERLGSP